MILPTRKDAAAIRQMAGKLQQSRGVGVHNSPGAMVTAQSFKRTRLNDPPAQAALFPVLVTYVTGAMGDATTKCAALYKVTRLDGTTVLGGSDVTPIAPAMPRPLGFTVANSPVGSPPIYDGSGNYCPAYGVGFYDSTSTTPDHFVLWDAGEVPNKGRICT